MNVHTNNKKGFTLIEVILVLAIAALIFLMIFVALPALQASQRDTARKNDASIVASAVTKYSAGERQSLVAADESDFLDYIDDLDQYDKDGAGTWATAINVADSVPTAKPTNKAVVNVYTGAKCDGSYATDSGANSRQAAVVVVLDNGNTTYCVDAS